VIAMCDGVSRLLMVSREQVDRLGQASLGLAPSGSMTRTHTGPPEQGLERFDPEDLVLEDHSKIPRDGFGDGVEIKGASEFPLHRGYRLRGDAAGDDEVEVVEIGVDVERESVRGDGARNVNADGG